MSIEEVWNEYSHKRYLALDDIRFRLDLHGFSQKEWNLVREEIQNRRKSESIKFPINSIAKEFWFFPSDSIRMNLEKIESIGNSLLRQIESNSLLSDFSLNSYLEESITSAIYEGA